MSALVVVPLFGLANAWRVPGSGCLISGLHVIGDDRNHRRPGRGQQSRHFSSAGLALKLGLGYLPGQVRYGHLIGGAVLAEIGFTISLIIADLAFDDPALQQDAKIGVLVGSAIAILGSLLLRYLGERLPLCGLDDADNPPALPAGPWFDPTLRRQAAGTR